MENWWRVGSQSESPTTRIIRRAPTCAVLHWSLAATQLTRTGVGRRLRDGLWEPTTPHIVRTSFRAASLTESKLGDKALRRHRRIQLCSLTARIDPTR